MKLRKFRLWRGVLLVALGCPLLGTGACLQITEDALIDGFFNAVTPLLIDRVESHLGIDTASGDATSTGGS